MLMKLCNYPGCNNLIPKGDKYCHKHYIKPTRKTYDNDKFYKTTAWRKLQRYHMAKQPYCVVCMKQGIVRRGEIVDHIKEISDGGEKLADSNLQTLCRACHNRKTALERRRRALDRS